MKIMELLFPKELNYSHLIFLHDQKLHLAILANDLLVLEPHMLLLVAYILINLILLHSAIPRLILLKLEHGYLLIYNVDHFLFY